MRRRIHVIQDTSFNKPKKPQTNRILSCSTKRYWTRHWKRQVKNEKEAHLKRHLTQMYMARFLIKTPHHEEEDTCHMRRIHVIWGGGYMSYEEEDTCHMRRRIHVIWGGGYMSYEEEDTCHMKRRIHIIWGGGYMSYDKEDALRGRASSVCTSVKRDLL